MSNLVASGMTIDSNKTNKSVLTPQELKDLHFSIKELSPDRVVDFDNWLNNSIDIANKAIQSAQKSAKD